MFKLSEIKELIKLVDQTSVQELEIENEGSRLCIRKPNKAEAVALPSSALPQAFSQAAPVQASAAQAERSMASSAPLAPVSSEFGDKSGLHTIVSPMVGTFYATSSPVAEPYVSVGSRVTEKTVVCIIEAMKLMNEIEAEVNGEIVEILAENGQLVEYGQPLFLVKLQ